MGNEIGKSLKNVVMSNPDVGFAELPQSTEPTPARKHSSASAASDTKAADPNEVPWDEVLKSIRAADYEQAVQLLSRDSELTAQLLKHEIAQLSTRERLLHVIRFKFFASVKQQQRELSAKFAVLFDNCGGNKREALEYLQHHVEQMLSARPTAPNHVTATVSLNDLEHVLKSYTTLLRVLEDYAYIEQIFALPTWLLFVSRALQVNEHVIQATLKHWQLEHRGLLTDMQSDGTVPAERMEHVTGTLDQLALLANRTEHYRAAVKLFYERAATRLGLQGYSFINKSSGPSRDSKQLVIEDHVHESLALFGAVSELLQTFYLPLEQLFLQHSITTMFADSDRELRADDTNSNDTRGSVLDLVFVMFEQATTRVLITANHALIATMIEHLAQQTIVHHLVTRELASRVRALVTELQTQLTGVLKKITATTSTAPTPDRTLAWLIYWLNELCAVPSDLDRLRDQVLVIAKQSRVPLDQGQLPLDQLITEHMTRAKTSCQQLIATTTRDLVAAVIYPQCCRQHVTRFERQDYDIDASKYKDYELNDPWIKALIDDLRALLVVSWQHKHVMHRDAWWQLIVAVLELLLSDVERVVCTKLYFSPLGAIQLDNDVRHLFEFTAALVAPDHSVRNQFTRTLQICSLLSLERVTEVYEYWTPAQSAQSAAEGNQSEGETRTDTIKWSLTADQVKAVLKRRRDFKADLVDRLKL